MSEPIKLGRRTSVMAAGTVVSRATGFARVLALGYALGFNHVSDAYNLANTLPNIVYELVLGGVVTATLVPLFVGLFDTESEEDAWRGVQAVATLVLAATAVLSVVFAIAAPLLVDPYAALNHTATAPAQRDLTITFMRYFAPQVVLLAAMAVGSSVLLARRRFAAPAFAPALNNLVTIAGLVAAPHFIDREAIRTLTIGIGGIVLLGAGETAGYFAQVGGLIPSLRSIGARFKPVWDPRHPAVRRAARLSGWTIGFVLANQLAYVLVVALANRRGGELSVYQAAFQFFQLPHAIIAVSITGALLPEMSAAAARLDRSEFDGLFRRGLRTIGVLLVPAAILMILFAGPALRLVLAHGRLSDASVALTATTLRNFALGLPGFSAFILCTRALQARQDTRRVFYLYVLENVINVVLALVLYPSLHVGGLAYSYAAAYTVSALIAYWVVLHSEPPLRFAPVASQSPRPTV